MITHNNICYPDMANVLLSIDIHKCSIYNTFVPIISGIVPMLCCHTVYDTV